MAEHRWTEEDGDKLRTCQNAKCTVRRRRVGVSCEQWQNQKRGHWHVVAGAGGYGLPIPPCTGTQPNRCTHINRVPVALNPGHSVVGGVSVGRCERPALPRLVVCEHHATPETIRLLVLGMAAEIERLKFGG